MLSRLYQIVAILLIFVSFNVLAHPHLFIKPSLELVVVDNAVTGLKLIWVWDQWWSAEVVAECDMDKNGVFDSKEIKTVFEDFFSAVKSFDYFTALYIDNKRIKINEVTHFSASIGKDKIVTYSFVIPLPKPLKGGESDIKIDFNDETVYTAFDRAIKLSPNDSVSISDYKSSEHGFYGASVSFKIKGK